MAQSTFILGKVQRAFRTYLRYDGAIRSWLPSSSVVSGISRGAQDDPTEPIEQDVSVSLPRVIIDCRQASHTAHTSGQFRAAVVVRLEESADDTSETTHLEHAGQLFDYLFVNQFAAVLTSTIEDFTAQLVIFNDQNYDIEERKWVATFHIDVECLGRDLT